MQLLFKNPAKKSKMTKLQLLHRALNERLMAAVEQIMEMVGGTVLEYEEETIRARKENEILRRRLRWMEGENPLDWPGLNLPSMLLPPDEAVHSGLEQHPVSLAEEEPSLPLSIKAEPVDSSECQPYRQDASFAASLHSADSEAVDPGVSVPAGIIGGGEGGVLWDSTYSYMAPLDFDPTVTAKARCRRGRKCMSFACPECGKLFGREQRLMLHMRVHSSERPYSYRSRKACFYGDQRRKRKHPRRSKLSREFLDDLSDSSEQTELSAGSAKVSAPAAAATSTDTTTPNIPETLPIESTSSSGTEGNATTENLELIQAKSIERKAKMHHCPHCQKVFTHVSRLRFHMKTHTKGTATAMVKGHKKAPPGQEEVKEQRSTEKAEKTEKKAQQQAKKQVIRNNETEVERARSGGQNLFKCSECKKMFARSCWLTFHLKSHKRDRALALKDQKQTQDPSNSPEKTSTTPPSKSTKEPTARTLDNSKVPVEKKIFSCSYCGKIFTRVGWLWNHIRTHAVKPPPKRDLIPMSISSDSSPRSAHPSITEPQSNEVTDDDQTVTKESKENAERSTSIDKQPKSRTAEQKKVTLESEKLPEPEGISDESEKINPEPNEMVVEPKELPEKSPGNPEDQVSRKTFPCEVCGKVYIHFGWLKSHKKRHKADKLVYQTSRYLETEEHNKASSENESIVEKPVKEKQHQHVEEEMETQDSLQSENGSEHLDADKMKTTPEEMEKQAQTADVKPKKSFNVPKTMYSCVFAKCGKKFARKNWLALHMISHERAALRMQADAEASKSDDTQEGSSTGDSKVQKGSDGGKAEFPCPFCDKVFPRSMRLMVHMQMHSGEKPYSYRQRKEQFYGDLTRQRVQDPDSQEPAIESSDEREKDGGFTGTETERSAVGQDHTSTSELMETVQPQTVRTGRKFSLLPLKSPSTADTSHSMKVSRTDSKSVDSGKRSYVWQPRILHKPIMSESTQCASPGGDDFRSDGAVCSDVALHQVSDSAAIDHNVGAPLPLTQLEYSNTCHDRQDLYGVSYTVLSETDNPDIVCIRLDSLCKSQENTSNAEKVLVKMGEQHSRDSAEGRKSELWQKDGEGQAFDEIDVGLDVEQEQAGNQARISSSHAKSSFSYEDSAASINAPTTSYNDKDGIGRAPFLKRSSTGVKPTVAESPCTNMKQGVLSDVDDDGGGGDDGWSDVCNVGEKKKRKISAKSKRKSKRSKVKDSSLSKSAQNVSRISDSDSQNAALGGEVNGGGESEKSTSVQQNEGGFSDQKRFTCVTCGSVFSGEASLIQHQKGHSVSDCTDKTPSASKKLKNKGKNNETKIKQQVVNIQTSDVCRDDAGENSHISGKSDSTRLEKMTKPQSSKDRSDNVTTSPRSKRESDKTSTHTNDLKKKKIVYCRLCGKACKEIKQHLMYDHSREPKAVEALCANKTSKERKELMSQLCSKQSVKPDTTNTLRDNTVEDALDKGIVHCMFCKGSYQRNEFSKHALICELQKPKDDLPLTVTERSEDLSQSNPGTTEKIPESENESVIKDSPTLQTLPESENILLHEMDPSIPQNSCVSPSPVQESCSSKTNPSFGPGSGDPPALNTGDTAEVMKLDPESLDPPILDLCPNKTEKVNPDVGNHIEKNLEVTPPVLDSGQAAQAIIPDLNVENPSTLQTSESPNQNSPVLECSGLPVVESCSSVAQEERDQNLSCPPLNTSREADTKKQSTSEVRRLNQSRFLNAELSVSPARVNSPLVVAGSINVEQHTDRDSKIPIIQNVDCGGESDSLPQPMLRQTVESVDSNLSLESPATPKTTYSKLVQTIVSDAESEPTGEPMPGCSLSQQLPGVTLETAKDQPHESISIPEFTNNEVPDPVISAVQEELNETRNSSGQEPGSTEHNKSAVALDSSSVQDPTLELIQQAPDAEMGTTHSATKQMLACAEDCREDVDETAKDTGGFSGVGFVDSDTAGTEKRKPDQEEGSSDREEKIKKRRKNDSTQVSAEEGTASSNAIQTFEVEHREEKNKSSKAQCCLYCKKTLFWMKQHLLSEHANEPDVAKALSYDKNSKERKQLLSLIRIKGNYLHSSDVVTSGKSNVSLSSQTAPPFSDLNNVQCLSCHGLFSENSIADHTQKCTLKSPDITTEPGPLSNPSCIVEKPSTEPVQVSSSLTDTCSAKEVVETNPEMLSHDPDRLYSRQEISDPQSVGFPVLYADYNPQQLNSEKEPVGPPTADRRSYSGEPRADLESANDISPNTNFATSQVGDDQTIRSKNEDEKIEFELSNQGGQTVERRRSSRVQAQPMMKNNALVEEKSSSQSSKVHVCEHCSATFCSPFHLRRHVYTHTGERPYWCRQCDIGFTQKYRLRNHKMNHHGGTQTNLNRNGVKRHRKQSCSSEMPTQSEPLQQPLTESSAALPETSSSPEEREISTNKDTKEA